jgi:hypothetical protein
MNTARAWEDDFDPEFIRDMDARFAKIMDEHSKKQKNIPADLRDVLLGDDDIPEFDF